MKTHNSFVLVISITTLISLHADNFTTLDGDLYTNAIVKRVEPDGLSITYADGITKLKFKNLPADVQAKYGYDPALADITINQQREAAALAIKKQQELTAAAQINAAKDLITKNTKTIREVESDQRSHIGKPFYLSGKLELSSYYNYGYSNAQGTHYAFRLTGLDNKDATLYMKRERAAGLRQQLLDSGGSLDGLYLVVIDSARFDDSLSLHLELLDCKPPLN